MVIRISKSGSPAFPINASVNNTADIQDITNKVFLILLSFRLISRSTSSLPLVSCFHQYAAAFLFLVVHQLRLSIQLSLAREAYV